MIHNLFVSISLRAFKLSSQAPRISLAMESHDPLSIISSGLNTKEPRAFECPTCNLCFTRLHTLKNHLSVHDNGAVFKCSTCDKRFGRLNDKKRHERTQHAEKKFVCRGQRESGGFWGCGKAFARKDALGEHLRSKRGERCRERVYHPESGRLSDVITIDLTGEDSDSTMEASVEPEDAAELELATALQRLNQGQRQRPQSAPEPSSSKPNAEVQDLSWDSIIDALGDSPTPLQILQRADMTRPSYTIFNDFLIENLTIPLPQLPLFLCPICSRGVERLDRFKAHLLEHLEDYTHKRAPYYCLECAQSFSFPILLHDHQNSGTTCGGSIRPIFNEFLKTQVLRSGRMHPLKWDWGCGRKMETHFGIYPHVCNSYQCRNSLEDVERWIADYLGVVLSDVAKQARNDVAVDSSEARGRAVAQREELTKWLLEIKDPQKQSIALKVVATKYDVVQMLLDGELLQDIEDRITDDIAKELYAIRKAEIDEMRERDVVNALWETVDALPMI